MINTNPTGPMIIIATLLLTIFHPGFAFGRQWQIKTLTSRCEPAHLKEGLELQEARMQTEY